MKILKEIVRLWFVIAICSRTAFGQDLVSTNHVLLLKTNRVKLTQSPTLKIKPCGVADAKMKAALLVKKTVVVQNGEHSVSAPQTLAFPMIPGPILRGSSN